MRDALFYVVRMSDLALDTQSPLFIKPLFQNFGYKIPTIGNYFLDIAFFLATSMLKK